MTDAAFDYRYRAGSYLDRAKEHLASGEDHRLAYACLELRFAIESLTYDLVRLYRDDLTEEALQAWQPRALFKELEASNPGALQGAEMRLSNPGEEDDPSKVLVFKEYRLNAQLAGKLHSALGHFLHERQLRDLERGKDVNHQTMRRKAEEAVTELDRVLSSTGFNIRMNHNVRWDCDCGEPCEASISFGQERKRWRCKACSQTYELVSVDDTIRVRLLRSYQNKAPLPSPDWTHHARSFREVRAMKVTDVRWVSEEEPATGSATSDD